MRGRCCSLWSRTCYYSTPGSNNWRITNLFHAKRQDCSLDYLSFPWHLFFHLSTLSVCLCPKGKMEEGEHCVWKGVWCGLHWSHIQSVPLARVWVVPGLVRKAVALSFALSSTVLTSAPPLLWNKLPSGQWCMAASQATVGLKFPCARVCLVSLHGLGHVLCIVWPGRLEHENTDHCYW